MLGDFKCNGMKNEWISVNDRLPEHMLDVLVSNSKDKWVVAGYLNHSNEWYNCFDESGVSIIPTHWMPLPEAPKK